jgi:FtsP/CotA-like multicopper oxidase with cupredoxin domain
VGGAFCVLQAFVSLAGPGEEAMSSIKTTRFLVTSLAAAAALLWGIDPGVRAQPSDASSKATQSKREAAKSRVRAERAKVQQQTGVKPKVTATTVTNAAALLAPAPPGFQDYSIPNYANSPLLSKFVDALPGLCATPTASNCIPVATPDTTTYAGADYYQLGVRDYRQQMHSQLPATGTALRGYYQKNGPDTRNRYLGPIIVAKRDRPVRIQFLNEKAPDGKHIIPLDTTVMGAGAFESNFLCATPPCADVLVGNFGENRSGIHLHGGFTPWISDGTPHQWVSPIGEVGDYKKGVSTRDVPDMPATADGLQTLFYPNQQSSRLMFYHDHAYGITRLNVYAGEAAGYLLTDNVEEGLINGGVLPNLGGVYRYGVPLVIQDKSFVHAGTYTTDPTWATVAPASIPGDLWFPHVYVPNQDPFFYFPTTTPDGMNPMGRWDYGPWIWPPVTVQVPGTLPNPSIVPEAFMDTMVVNGKAFPFFNVNRTAYRFRVLNASNDRFLNLQLYYAVQGTRKCDLISGNTNPANGQCKEVAMVPRNGMTYTVSSPGETPVVATVPDDAFRGSVPDPRNAGPKMIQIGNEGGLLPAAVERNHPPVPVTYDTDPKSMTVGNVKQGTIIVGPGERADVVIDFSRVPRGSTLILYNDAPAAFPASDPRYDYFTGNEDLTASGGAPSTLAGFGPNTRTVMQFRVSNTVGNPPVFNFAALTSAVPTAYAASQDKPLVPQPDYPFAGMPAANQYATLFNTTSFSFTDEAGATQTVPIHQKAIAEEFDSAYGRMSALLGTEAMVTGNQGQNTFGFFYVDPSTENLPAGVTQIWKITHNGVDTHAIHWHLLNVQVINRVDWAGVIKAPDPDELGWKETLRMNPLEDIIVAVKAAAPVLPFTVGDSVRPKDVTMPLGSMLNFTQPWPYEHTAALQQPVAFPIEAANPANTVNEMTNFGWEYVWHCHLLGHEENDMMRPLVMTGATGGVVDTIAPMAAATVSPAPNGAGWINGAATVTLTAVDNPGGTGVASLSYSTDAGATYQTYTGPVPITAQGITTITYFATDSATPVANSSTPATLSVRLDSIAPTWTATPTATVINGARRSVTVAGTATDGVAPPASGVSTGTAAGSYVMTGPSPASGTFSIAANGSFSFSRTKLKPGAYTVTVTVMDNAGNALISGPTGFTIP